MKIHIHKTNGKIITIPLPNAILFNATILKITLNLHKNHQSSTKPDIAPENVDKLCRIMKQWAREHSPWELVRVESADGNTVLITI